MIWLPTSESKSVPTSGASLDLPTLTRPALGPARERVVEALSELGAGGRAAAVLGLGPRSAAGAVSNTRLREAPCAPARDLFTGVLYAAAELGSLSGVALERATGSVGIFCGLLGVVGLQDRLPDHRLPMGATLPGIGALAPYWRRHLPGALGEETGGRVVLDLRSGPYRSAFPAAGAHVVRLGVVRGTGGRRTVVSHEAKRWRGLVCGALLRRGPLPLDEGGTASAVGRVARAATVRDARGRTHRVTDVEVGEAIPTPRGGTVRDVVLVLD